MRPKDFARLVHVTLAAAAAASLAFCNAAGDPGNPTSTDIDLAPGKLTAGTTAADGGTLAVTLSLNNLQAGTVSTAFGVDFYMTLTSTFNTSTDSKIGSAAVAAGSLGGSTSITVPATLSIPTGALNQAVYLYAVVDAAGVVAETNESNNTSTVATAGVTLVYDSSNAGRTYAMLLETYAPSGSGTVNTIMALYDGTGTQLQSVNDSSMGGYAAISSALGPGTYYVMVTAYADGAYAMAVRTAGIDHVMFTPLGSKGADPYGVNDNPHIYPPANMPFTPPVPVVSMPVGTMVNRYAVGATGHTFQDDWFTFMLP
jgi:subtilase family serine protease